MNRSTCVNRLRILEDNPSRVPAFYYQLTALIQWLTASTYKSFDPFEKAIFAATEMRARLVLERYRKLNAN